MHETPPWPLPSSLFEVGPAYLPGSQKGSGYQDCRRSYRAGRSGSLHLLVTRSLCQVVHLFVGFVWFVERRREG